MGATSQNPQDSLLLCLLFPMHPFRLEYGLDRHWLHHPEQLPCDRGINPRTAKGHAPRQAHHKVRLVATIEGDDALVTRNENCCAPSRWSLFSLPWTHGDTNNHGRFCGVDFSTGDFYVQ
jgi:hypothetical protein